MSGKRQVLHLYRIDWEDANADGGWKSVDVKIIPRLMLVHSVGYCVAEDKKAIVLCQQLTEAGRYSDTITIPKNCITKKVKLNHQVIYEN